MTLLCIPARLYVLPKIFEGWELCVLDGEEEQIEEWVAAKEQSIRNFHAQFDVKSEMTADDGEGSGADENV